ncbi:MAG TPA: 2-oxoacid:acceptor oxidoreductase family protein [Longimicrobiales bacterium]|nr:2-oxoacid:acceptor oxidoreductase family protein [Longimicrobiales bacterium]
MADPQAALSGERVNDFAFKIGTVNGTGSASANGLLMQSICRMGIPVSGKNVFPSNIQGLPTWYELRVNGQGYNARTPDFDLIVAMNPATYARDIAEVRPGGWLLHDSSWPLESGLRRDDVTFLGVPFGQLCVDHFTGGRERVLMKNIVYVGTLAALLDIDRAVVDELLHETFSRKKALMDSNLLAIALGHGFAREHFDCPLPIRLSPMRENDDAVLMDGNTAAALGCVYAGATVAAWYPITPATSLMDAFRRFCGRYRTDADTGAKRYMILQAEDELAAAGMVIGAGWAGARAFSPTAGPGISLMSEFIGLAYYAEIPSVFFDVQRAGPSTGMPTRTQQGDLTLVAYASHGDTKHLALFPADPGECFDFAVRAFDLTERFQTPVFVVSDLDIGMNDWLIPRLRWDDGYAPDRGKVLDADALEKMTAFHRYLGDDEPDQVAPRTLPGSHPRGAYFTRGSGHDRYGRYTEDAAGYREVVDRLARKIGRAAAALPEPEIVGAAEFGAGRNAGAFRLASHAGMGGAAGALGNGATAHDDAPGERAASPVGTASKAGAPAPEAPSVDGVITVGGCRGAVLEALDVLAGDGTTLDFLRVRSFPFPRAVHRFVAEHARCFVVEQNRDAQLRTLLINETGVEPGRLIPVLDYGGVPLSAAAVLDGIRHPGRPVGAGAPATAATSEIGGAP